jgi:hypothetical protein
LNIDPGPRVEWDFNPPETCAARHTLWATPTPGRGRLPGYGFPEGIILNKNATPGLPGSSTDPSAPAPLNHPGRPSRCFCSFLPSWLQASPNPEGWPPPSQCNEAEPGSLALGLMPSSSGKDHSPSPPRLLPRKPTYSPCLVTLRGRPQLHGERATAMVDTFQSTGSARLGLAYPDLHRSFSFFRITYKPVSSSRAYRGAASWFAALCSMPYSSSVASAKADASKRSNPQTGRSPLCLAQRLLRR